MLRKCTGKNRKTENAVVLAMLASLVFIPISILRLVKVVWFCVMIRGWTNDLKN